MQLEVIGVRMDDLKKFILYVSILFSLISIASLFGDWLGLLFENGEYTTSLWSDPEARVKYLIIFFIICILILQVSLLLIEKYFLQITVFSIILEIINLIVSINYYSTEKESVLKIEKAGVDVVFLTKPAFILFVIVNILLIILGGLFIVIDKKYKTDLLIEE
jgi:hypothetical protein